MIQKKLYLISKENVLCQAYLSQEVAHELNELIKPYFSIERSKKKFENIWTIFEDIDQTRITESFIRNIEKNGDEPPIDLYYNSVKREIMFYNTPKSWRAMFLLRILRNIFRWEFYNENTVFLHGGLLNYRNNGVAILGPKRAGKTSTILSLLTLENMDFSTNDDVALRVEESRVKAYGWPRSIGVRKDTLFSLRDFAPNYLNSITKLQHPGQSSIENEEKNLLEIYDFLPNEIVNCYEKKIVSHTNLNFIVFPMFSNDLTPKVSILDNRNGYKELISCLEKFPSSYNMFLKKSYNLKNMKSETLIEEITSKVVFLKLEQSIDNLQSGAELLSKTIDELIERRTTIEEKGNIYFRSK